MSIESTSSIAISCVRTAINGRLQQLDFLVDRQLRAQVALETACVDLEQSTASFGAPPLRGGAISVE